MRTLKFFTLIFAMTLFACGGEEVEYDEQQEGGNVIPDYATFSAEVDELEAKINENPSDEDLLKQAITKFQDFAGFFPEDPKSPDYLLKASDFSLMVKLPEKSVKILDRIIDKYPDYDKMEDVLYIRADHLDWELRDTTKAKAAYQTYIDKYPNTSRAEDAALRIKYIALSFEEYAAKIISEYEASN